MENAFTILMWKFAEFQRTVVSRIYKDNTKIFRLIANEIFILFVFYCIRDNYG